MFCFVNIIQIIDASLQQAKGKKKSLIQRIQVRNKIIWSSHSCLESQRRHCVVGFVVHFSWPKWLPPGPQGCPSVYNCPTSSPNYPHTTSKHRCLLDIMQVVSDPEGFKELVLFSWESWCFPRWTVSFPPSVMPLSTMLWSCSVMYPERGTLLNVSQLGYIWF